MRNSIQKSAGLLVMMLLVLSGCAGQSAAFTDDFSDTSSGWIGGSQEMYAQGYVGGRYVFQIFVPDWFVWSTPGKNYDDVEVEVLSSAEGNSDNHYGLLCRAQGDEFYYFAISADGYYGIFHREKSGNLQLLTGSSMKRSTVVRGQDQQNRITVSCVGSTLSLFVNGEKIAEVIDDTLAKGDVGMAAGTISSTASNIWFDDFAVRKP